MDNINKRKRQGLVPRNKNELVVHSNTLVSRGLVLATQLLSPKKSAILLIVEDSETLRDMIVDYLHAGYPELLIETAADGVEALEKIDYHVPDYLITNINMPRMDGIGLLGTLHARGIMLTTLATSGWWEEEAFRLRIVEEGIESAANISFLKKPFRIESLIAWVDTAHGMQGNAATQYRIGSTHHHT